MICRTALISTLVCLLLVGTFAADDTTYVTGKILSVEKRAPTSFGSTPTDQPPQSSTATYKFVINAGDTNYTCTLQMATSNDGTWLVGRQIQVRVKRKVLYVKNSIGDIERCSIVKSAPAK